MCKASLYDSKTMTTAELTKKPVSMLEKETCTFETPLFSYDGSVEESDQNKTKQELDRFFVLWYWLLKY